MKRIEDERIIAEKRRINSSAFGICFLALWGILLFRQFVLHQNINEYLDIFLLTIGLSIYITVNNVLKGLYLTYRDRKMKRKAVLIGAMTGTAVFAAVHFFIMRNEYTGPEGLIKFVVPVIIFLIVWIAVQSVLLNISQTKGDREAEDE